MALLLMEVGMEPMSVFGGRGQVRYAFEESSGNVMVRGIDARYMFDAQGNRSCTCSRQGLLISVTR